MGECTNLNWCIFFFWTITWYDLTSSWRHRLTKNAENIASQQTDLIWWVFICLFYFSQQQNVERMSLWIICCQHQFHERNATTPIKKHWIHDIYPFNKTAREATLDIQRFVLLQQYLELLDLQRPCGNKSSVPVDRLDLNSLFRTAQRTVWNGQWIMDMVDRETLFPYKKSKLQGKQLVGWGNMSSIALRWTLVDESLLWSISSALLCNCVLQMILNIHLYSTRLSWSERSLRISQNDIKHVTWNHYKTPNATPTFSSICFHHLFSGSVCLPLPQPSTTKRLLKYWKDLNTSTSSWVMSWWPIKRKGATDGHRGSLTTNRGYDWSMQGLAATANIKPFSNLWGTKGRICCVNLTIECPFFKFLSKSINCQRVCLHCLLKGSFSI